MTLNNRVIIGIILAIGIGAAAGVEMTKRATPACDISNVQHADNPTYQQALNETKLMEDQLQCAEENQR